MIKIAIMSPFKDEGKKLLINNNFKVINEKKLSKTNYKSIEGVILDTRDFKNERLDKFKNLKIISRFGVGVNNVDLKVLKKKKIQLSITKNSIGWSVAEHAFTLIMTCLKNIILLDKSAKTQKKSKRLTYDLFKKNILIIGYGRTGKSLSKILKNFSTNIFIYDPFIKKTPKFVKKVSLAFGLKNADIISIHTPLSLSTKNLISKKEFSKMKKNAIIINTSRGGIINENYLDLFLKKRKILAAGIDVYENEPELNLPLSKNKFAVFTPHVSSSTEECRTNMSIEAAQNIINFYKK
jgi:D-3-phosphoglycerate dehydrogenase / 2-oxoglutarate reductase